MKKLLLCIALCLPMVGVISCSNLTVATIKTEGVIITSVDVGMNTWALYVNAHLTDGKVKQPQLDSVKKAYNTYYDAQLICKAALEKYITSGSKDQTEINTANASVASAEAAVLDLLNTYIVK